MTTLHEVAEIGDLEGAKFIGSDPDLVTSKDADGATPLHYAALHDRKNIVELLIDKSADVNAADHAGETPLHYAANGDIAAILLSAGANVNARDNKGRTALHRAARSGQPVVIGFLLASGAEVNATEWEYAWTPLHYASNKQSAALLISNGASISARDNKDRIPLHRAAENGYVDVVDLLVRKGSAINDRDNEGWTPLHYAARWHGNADMVNTLLAHGADPSATNRFGMTPSQLASWHGYKHIVTMLHARQREK